MLKIVIGTNEGKVLCISNNKDEIKASMVNYLIDTDQEPTEDFFESRNWGEYDIEVYEYHQPQLNENQQIVLEWLKYPLNDIPNRFAKNYFAYVTCLFLGQAPDKVLKAYQELSLEQRRQVLAAFAQWGEQEEQ
ncbi:hypothetical protein [Enterococcus durans]|uniref:Uncharacterized protein n=2 Tax=Enterococcus durans TaxID=53345 RepID=A0AB36S7J0_9ENTE|nr:hypothetical protein [Enterococcus durans]EOT35976.1 hypothetical protein OMS_00347 [Enterococcus durans ATCC 6056]EOU19096.1 hypothetical protein I571_02096 [Enterococcus durans ATCC 6056]PEH44846.1 hypothetical protein CRM96_07420 [Enterococcus durans]QPQ26096.1 hypothetical protein I4Q39_07575 [Enterococcus durans]QXB37883.1 hypothetical protein I6L67_01575 [Enterococcus durans]